MTYSPTSTSSPNSPYNLDSAFESADYTPYLGLHTIEQHLSCGTWTSSQSSFEALAEGTTLSDTGSDYGTRTAAQSFRRLSMADEHQESQGKGKAKAPSRDTSPSGSSQGDVADNEAEPGHSGLSEHAEPPPPPKKKRTRTLTTPHQAAVLHALLAQSRFPTTAMREEVGRSIGLSARKVQIWFQNQRQKARRPRGQIVPPLTRPPQYGPFPSAGPSSIHEEQSTDATGSNVAESSHTAAFRSVPFGSPTSGVPHPLGWRDLHSSEGYSHTSGISSQLSGPGIPGSVARPPSPRTTRTSPYADTRRPQTSHAALGSSRMHMAIRPVTADEGERTYSQTLPRILSPDRRSVDFAITLPPMRLGRPRSRTFAEPGPSRQSDTALQRSMRRATSPAGPSRLPPILSESFLSHATSSLPIPPPFTLQPHPQWDDPTFSPFSRPSRHTTSQRQMSPYEPVILPPAAIAEGHLPPAPHTITIPPYSGVPSSPSFPSLYSPSSPMPPPRGPSSPWHSRRPDDDNASSRNRDSPR